MSFLVIGDSRTGRADLPLDLPVTPQSSGAECDSAQSLCEDNWENEGGHVGEAKSPTPTAALSANDVETREAQVRRMESKLSSDFADGRLGYNTYAHRSRVLRQLKAKLDFLQAGVQSQEQPD